MPKKILSEKEIDELFIVRVGFNVSDKKGDERRFDAGTDAQPNFVRRQDFTPEQFKDLLEMKAIEIFERDELRPNESIAAEIIEK